MYDPNSALAASGGRMGGSCFSSSSSSSSRSSSSSSSSYDDDYKPSWSSSSYKPSSSSSSSYYGGGGEPSSSSSDYGGGGETSSGVNDIDGFTCFEIVICLVAVAFILVLVNLPDHSETTASDNTSVLKLQVGLLGSARSLQTELNKIAEAADTSSRKGLSYILTETTVALLRHPDYCISGYSSVDLKRSVEDCEKQFNRLSIEERGKFDEETLVNVDNTKSKSTRSQRSNNGLSNEYIMITILAAAEGVYKLPTINGSKDLKEALLKLESIPSNKLLAAEVLWTPQSENDILSKQELLEDYPLLRPW